MLAMLNGCTKLKCVCVWGGGGGGGHETFYLFTRGGKPWKYSGSNGISLLLANRIHVGTQIVETCFHSYMYIKIHAGRSSGGGGGGGGHLIE